MAETKPKVMSQAEAVGLMVFQILRDRAPVVAGLIDLQAKVSERFITIRVLEDGKAVDSISCPAPGWGINVGPDFEPMASAP